MKNDSIGRANCSDLEKSKKSVDNGLHVNGIFQVAAEGGNSSCSVGR